MKLTFPDLPSGSRRWIVGGLAVLVAGGGVALGASQMRAPAQVATPPAASASTTPSPATGSSPTAAGTATTTATPTTTATATPTASSPATASLTAIETAAEARTVTGSGTIEPVKSEGLNFNVAGTVASVDVHPGERVAAGAVLARLDSTSLESQLKQAQAQVAQAQASVDSNKSKIDNDKLAIQQAATALQQKQAALATAQAAETLTAPVAGTVESVDATVGQSLSPGAKVLSIVPPGGVAEVQADVAQSSASGITVGERASVDIAAAGAVLGGSVTAVGNGTAGSGSGSGSQGGSSQGTIQVTIALTNAPASLRDGMTANVNIYTGGNGNVQSSGTVRYANEWQVTAPEGGTLTDLTVSPGEAVTKGQTLAHLGAASLDAAVQSAQQAVQQAQDALAQDQATLQQDEGGATAVAQAGLASAKAAEEAAAANLQGATLTAPFSGIIGQVNIQTGQPVSASGGSGTGTTAGLPSGAITLIGGAGFQATIDVPDTDIGKVRLGQTAWVTPVDGALPEKARVTQIAPQAAQGTGEPAFPVTVTIVGNAKGLLTGEKADVAIQVGSGS